MVGRPHRILFELPTTCQSSTHSYYSLNQNRISIRNCKTIFVCELFCNKTGWQHQRSISDSWKDGGDLKEHQHFNKCFSELNCTTTSSSILHVMCLLHIRCWLVDLRLLLAGIHRLQLSISTASGAFFWSVPELRAHLCKGMKRCDLLEKLQLTIRMKSMLLFLDNLWSILRR